MPSKDTAIQEMTERARELEPDAIVDLDHEAISSGNMLMVSANRTAVRLYAKKPNVDRSLRI